MSCNNNSNCYLPQPPRAWSRVQNSCSLETGTDNNGLVRVPYTNKFVSASLLYSKMDMLNKGNVLQYKANSSNLTKAQRYSKIAKGQWVNRNTTWATQSTRGYTNPNNTSLKRSGNVVNIAIDPITGAVIGPTTAPPTCPKPVTPVNPDLPSNGGGGSDVNDPVIPPPVEPTEGSDVFPAIIPDTPVEPIVIQDGGTLICSEQENICTGETKRTVSQQLCNPTSDSDVPGTIQQLCWNDGTPTWYPRSRYIMTNSTNKWPYSSGIPGVNNSSITYTSAIKPYAPYITSITSNLNIITLTWIQDEACLAVTRFDIYQDGLLIKSVDGTIFSADFVGENCVYYQYYIIGVASGGDVFSDRSNVVGIDIAYIEPPNNLTYITTDSGIIQLSWNLPNPNCDQAVSYKIYQVGDPTVNTTTSLNYSVSGLTNCSSYTFLVSSVDINGIESPSVTISNVVPYWPNSPTDILWKPFDEGIILNWTAPTISCTTFDHYEVTVKNSPGGDIIDQPYSVFTTSITIQNLTNCNTYDFEITTVDTNGNTSTPALRLTQQILWPGPPGNISGIAGDGACQVSWSLPTTNTCANTYVTKYIGQATGFPIIDPITTPHIFTGLTNGVTYTFSIWTIALINGYTCQSTPSTITLIPNVYYTSSITPTGSGIAGGYNYVYFTNTSNITFNLSSSYVSSVNTVCVGGGGGGGSGASQGGNHDSGRGGGGAGCDTSLNFVPIIGSSYQINIGSGGTGGQNTSDGSSGGTSSFINPSSVTLLSCSGGGGGSFGPGFVGSAGTPNNGGAGGDTQQNGNNSVTISSPLSIPASLPTPFSPSYGGGGGGSDQGNNGGSAGYYGNGGLAYQNTDYNGQTATAFGSGGGGAGNNNASSGNYYYDGGDGASGFIGFWWQQLF
jgi:hypothetical protein